MGMSIATTGAAVSSSSGSSMVQKRQLTLPTPSTSAPTQPPGQPSTPNTTPPATGRSVGIRQTARMRVHLGSDHAGFELKAAVAARLEELGHEPVDHGPDT